MVAFFVIITFVAFILADAAVQWSRARKAATLMAGAPQGASTGGLLDSIPIPRGLFVAPGHTWVGLETAGGVRVGMDGLVSRAIGRIDAVELPEEGRAVARGQPLFTVRQGSRRAAFVAPVDGVVTAVNRGLGSDRDALADPYRKGWICAIDPRGLARSLRQLLVAEEAKEWLQAEARRLHDLIVARPLRTAAAGEVMQDGGQLATGVLEAMDEETWALFAKEFLLASPGKTSA